MSSPDEGCCAVCFLLRLEKAAAGLLCVALCILQQHFLQLSLHVLLLSWRRISCSWLKVCHCLLPLLLLLLLIPRRYRALCALFAIPDSFVEEFVLQEPQLLCLSAPTLKAKFDSLLVR